MVLPAAIYADVMGAFQFFRERWRRVALMIVFFGMLAVLIARLPWLTPIVFAAALVLPMRLSMRAGTRFAESDFERFSPVLANLSNYRFACVTLLFVALPVSHLVLDVDSSWFHLGSFPFVVGAASAGVLAWSEGLYQKNFHFDRWHPIERTALITTGGLTLVSPAFAPLFLLVFTAVIRQFDFPGIGHFNVTHSRLPHTMLMVVSAFAVVDVVLAVQSHHVVFLLLCGYAAHYFHPGVAKLANGPVYYLRHNNPIDMFLNAYQIGWLSSLDEDTVLRIGRFSERVKPVVNVVVVLIEMGAILVFLSPDLAIVIVLLTLSLHLLILATTGDDFWKWMTIDLAVVVGLALVREQPPIVFGDPEWLALSIVFVALAPAWMNPASMGWLDVPYVELFRFEADLRDGRTGVPIHSNIFRPFDSITTQGITGTLTYLGENPRITYSHGAITQEENKRYHRQLRGSIWEDPPDTAHANKIVEEWGLDMYDVRKTKRLEEFVRRFVEAQRSNRSRVLRYLSSPREFYSAGLSDRKSYDLVPEVSRMRIYRIDGIWTNEGFVELSCVEVVSVAV